ncbi:MAG: head-tail connector protein [Sphingobacterium sp.]
MRFTFNEDKLRCAGNDNNNYPLGLHYETVIDMITEPVTLSEFKAHCRIDYATDDALCLQYIKAARQYMEEFTQKSFGPKTMRLTYLSLPANFQLMYGPVTSAGVTVNGDYVSDAVSDAGSIEYEAGYDPLPDLLKVAVMKYAAGLYMIRENIMVSESGSTQDPITMIDDAEKLAMKYSNVTWF